jgi:ankyrin repeat protein
MKIVSIFHRAVSKKLKHKRWNVRTNKKMLSLDEVLHALKKDPTSRLLERVGRAQCTPLLEAIVEKRQDDIDFLLSLKANVHARHEYGDSAIHIASQQNNPELVVQLVNCRANVDALSRIRMTPLMGAIIHGQDRLVDTLLRIGASVHIHNKHGVTPLYLAVNHNHVACVIMLMTYGADPYVRHEGISSPVERAVELNYHESLHEMVERTDIRKQPILHSLIEFSIRKKHTMCMEILLHDGIHLNHLLFYAIEKACLDGVILLFQRGANSNCKDVSHRTPIVWAAVYNDRPLFDVCLQYGADINASNPPVLGILARHGGVPFVKYALSKGANINKDYQNSTPLIEAARYGNEDVIHVLIQHGANISYRNVFKESAADIASYNYHHSCNELLKKAEALSQLTYGHDMFSEMLTVTIPTVTWVHALSKPARRKAMDILLETRYDEMACFVALFEGEDKMLKRFRQGEDVCFSESWLRGLVRPLGNRMYRRRLVRYLVQPYHVRQAFHTLTDALSG